MSSMRPPKLSVKVHLPGIERMIRKLGPERKGLFDAIGIEILKLIHRNFEMGGAWGRWAALKFSTMYGRRGRGGKPLQGTGRLKASFRWEATANGVRVGSPLKIALYHQEGRKGPWIIKPRRAKALAFPFPPRMGGTAKLTKGMVSSSGLASRSAKFFRESGFMVVRHVKHPGYPARPILPPESVVSKIVLQTVSKYLEVMG